MSMLMIFILNSISGRFMRSMSFKSFSGVVLTILLWTRFLGVSCLYMVPSSVQKLYSGAAQPLKQCRESQGTGTGAWGRKELFPASWLLCLSPLTETVGQAHRYMLLSQSSWIWIPAFHKQL